MYSLQHGVNLSRRACRINIWIYLFVCQCSLFYSCSANPTSQTSTGSYRPDVVTHSQPVTTTDKNAGAYPGLQFGPMGPIDRSGPLLSSGLLKQEPLQQNTPTTGVGESEVHVVERYKIMTVDFARVETPFLIGLWIFCASLAKIGKFSF